MNKKQQKLLEGCEPYEPGTKFNTLYIIPGGKLYRGFWGKNGYNKIYLVCVTREGKKYVIGTNSEVDILQLWDLDNASHFNIDVPKEYNCVRLFTIHSQSSLVIPDKLSTIIVKEVRNDE